MEGPRRRASRRRSPKARTARKRRRYYDEWQALLGAVHGGRHTRDDGGSDPALRAHGRMARRRAASTVHARSVQVHPGDRTATESVNSSPAFAWEGNHAQHGGGDRERAPGHADSRDRQEASWAAYPSTIESTFDSSPPHELGSQGGSISSREDPDSVFRPLLVDVHLKRRPIPRGSGTGSFPGGCR